MKSLIVDDEPIARRLLKEELQSISGIEIIGEAENGATALAQITSTKPDLVFLDLEMPGMTGLEMLEHLNGGDNLPTVVIVTAYDEFAIKAFDAGAIDYLLKPIHHDRLVRSVDRARQFIKSPLQRAENLAQLQDVGAQQRRLRTRKIVGKLNAEYFLLDLSDILVFQADGDLTWIVTVRQRYLSSQNLKSLQERLVNTTFFRIHRNALVNINHIRKMSVLTSQRWLITLNNGLEVIVSKRQAKHVRSILSGFDEPD